MADDRGCRFLLREQMERRPDPWRPHAIFNMPSSECCGGNSQRRGIRDRRVSGRHGRVPRERFVRPDSRDEAYADCALAIDCGQTISQPYMVALMTRGLEAVGRGKGSGDWHRQRLSNGHSGRIGPAGRQHRASRASFPQQRGEVLRRLGYANVTLVVGDGTLGWPEQPPYDRIVVTAAAATCPEPLLSNWPTAACWSFPSAAGTCRRCKRFAAWAVPWRWCLFPHVDSSRWWADEGWPG